MKRPSIVPLSLVLLVTGPAVASPQSPPLAPGSVLLTGQIGLNAMVRTADRFADPFDAMPAPVGAALDVMLTDHLSVGGTIMYDRWSDYLGLFCGKWTFRLFKPSLDVAYHRSPERVRSLDLLAGVRVGYNLVGVGHEMACAYAGQLESEPLLGPVFGMNLRLRPGSPGHAGRLLATARVSWSVAGTFSGVYGVVGIGYRLK